jgi:hypothetical protein
MTTVRSITHRIILDNNNVERIENKCSDEIICHSSQKKIEIICHLSTFEVIKDDTSFQQKNYFVLNAVYQL